MFNEAKKSASFKLFFLVIVLVVMVSGPSQAQQDSCLHRTIAVNVLSEDVHTIEGLSTQNFRGKVRGHTVKIVSVNRDSGPRRIVIVLDASGSMRDVWRLEISAAEGLLNTDKDSSFALLTFSTQIDQRIDFTPDRKKLLDLLAGLEGSTNGSPKGRTALRDALAGSLDLLRPL